MRGLTCSNCKKELVEIDASGWIGCKGGCEHTQICVLGHENERLDAAEIYDLSLGDLWYVATYRHPPTTHVWRQDFAMMESRTLPGIIPIRLLDPPEGEIEAVAKRIMAMMVFL